jgi:hypothetical protein
MPAQVVYAAAAAAGAQFHRRLCLGPEMHGDDPKAAGSANPQAAAGSTEKRGIVKKPKAGHLRCPALVFWPPSVTTRVGFVFERLIAFLTLVATSSP